MTVWQISKYVVVSDEVDDGPLSSSRIVMSTRSQSRILLDADLWGNIEAGRLLEAPPQILNTLIDAEILVDADENELSYVLDQNRQATGADANLEQIIQPTASCQLDCDYCGQEHHPKLMDDATQNKVLSSVQRTLERDYGSATQYQHLRVGWFGAEPLMGLSVIRRMSPDLYALSETYDCGYEAHLVTNGLLLTPQIAAELEHEHYVKQFEITIDGLRESHDRRRPTKSGHGSYDQIVDNVVAVCHDPAILATVNIRCNVDKDNFAEIPELIETFVALGIHQRIKLYFSPVYSWGNDADKNSLEPQRYATAELSWYAQMLKSSFRLDIIPKRRYTTCIAIHRDALVHDAYGAVFDCTEVPYVPAYGEPNTYQIGVAGVPVTIGRTFSNFFEIVEFESEQPCHGCRVLPVCGGACPKSWREGSSPCPSFKHNLSQRLLLDLASRSVSQNISSRQ